MNSTSAISAATNINEYNEFTELMFEFPNKFDISNSFQVNGNFVTNNPTGRISTRYSYSMKDLCVVEYHKLFSKNPQHNFNAIKFFIQRILCDGDGKGFGVFNDIFINCDCTSKIVGDPTIVESKKKIFVKPNDVVKLAIELLKHKYVPLIFKDFDQLMLFINNLKNKYYNYQEFVEKTCQNKSSFEAISKYFINLDNIYEFNENKFDEYLSMVIDPEFDDNEISKINRFFDCESIEKYFGDVIDIKKYRKTDEETGDGICGLIVKRFANGKEIEFIGELFDYNTDEYLSNYQYGKRFDEIFDLPSFVKKANKIYNKLNIESLPKIDDIYESLKKVNRDKIIDKLYEITEFKDSDEKYKDLQPFINQYFHIIYCYIGLVYRVNTLELESFYSHRPLFNRLSEKRKLNYDELVNYMRKYEKIN